jgi:hypothetical protein
MSVLALMSPIKENFDMGVVLIEHHFPRFLENYYKNTTDFVSQSKHRDDTIWEKVIYNPGLLVEWLTRLTYNPKRVCAGSITARAHT